MSVLRSNRMVKRWLQLGQLLWLAAFGIQATADDGLESGRSIMEASQQKHERYPYVFEQVDLITKDRSGATAVRKARRYWRVESDGAMRFLWTFEQPPELRGVAVLAWADGEDVDAGLYLPAYGQALKRGEHGGDQSSMAAKPVLGTDFSIQDLSPENLPAYVYQRMKDVTLGEAVYYQVSARPLHPESAEFPERRLLLRQDTLFIERTDYYDHLGRLVKRLTRHDLKPHQSGSWRAGMSLMRDFRYQHQTLIKVRQRVDSSDYVPRDLFSPHTLFAGQHLLSPEQWSLASGGVSVP